MTHTNRFCAAFSLAVVAACGGGTTGPRPSASLSATANPSPITPIVCPQSSCGSALDQLEASSVVTLREAGGVAGAITTVTFVLRRSSDNGVIVNASPAITTRFPANGSIQVPVGVHWDRSQHSDASTLTVTITARDDNQNDVTASITIPVAAFTGT